MRLECIHCGKQYSLQDENAGAHFKCRRCGKISPVAAITAAVTEAVAVDNAPTGAARPRSTAEPAIVCAACGKPHRLPSKVSAELYRCSACGAPMPAGRSDAQSASTDQVVWAEVVSTPATTPPLAKKLATPGSSDDLFGEMLPAPRHVLSSAPAVGTPPVTALVEESDSSYRLEPAIAEAVAATRAVPQTRARKTKRAATKKRKSDTVPLWVYLSMVPCAICVWVALSYRSPAMFAVFPIYGGVLSICGAVYDWEWFFSGRKARRWVNLFGRDGARGFYGVLGVVLILMGVAMAFAPRPVDDARGRAGGQQHQLRNRHR